MLVKYVLVTESGNWLDMADRYTDMQDMAAKHPGTHVERWKWREVEEGHELVCKEQVPGHERGPFVTRG